MSLGKHVLAEFSGCNPDILNDDVALSEIMRAAADKAGATVIDGFFHRFQPQGVTGVLVLNESHLSIHTWPELGYAAVDCYTCGSAEPYIATSFMLVELQAKFLSTLQIRRGIERKENDRIYYDLK